MTRKIIYQPVIYTVWNNESCQLLKKSHVADSIKRFTEVKCRERREKSSSNSFHSYDVNMYWI